MFVFQIFIRKFGVMYNTDIFKIETNHVVPSQGKILISEPFLCDHIFGRSVILLVDYTQDGAVGLVMNKPLPILLNEVLDDFSNYQEDIPIYKGGPLSVDTLFYLHTYRGVHGAIPIEDGFYMNGDFNEIKACIKQNKHIEGNVRFFLGYSGWAYEQLEKEINENTWIVGEENKENLMDEKSFSGMWRSAMSKLGGKYKMWSRFPQVPSLN